MTPPMKRRISAIKRLLKERRPLEILRRILRKTLIFIASHTVYSRWYKVGCHEMFKTMKEDTSFNVPDSQLMSIIGSPVQKYEVSNVRVGDLKRFWDGKIIPLSETATYAYIVNGDEERYRKYVLTVCERHGITDTKRLADIVSGDLARVKRTTESLMNDGYDVRKSAVVVFGDRNIIMDGIHRSCILWKKFGSDYEFPVLKIYYPRLF